MNSEELWNYAQTTVLLHAQVTHLIRQIGCARLYLDSLLWADELDEVEIAAVTCRLELYYVALKNVWSVTVRSPCRRSAAVEKHRS
jgi:hypothetical protein